VSMEE